MNKKVSLFYLYGLHNAGDAAIGLGTLSFLKRQGYDISAFSRWPESFPEYQNERLYYQKNFDNILIHGSPYYFRRSRSLIKRLYYYSISSLGLLFSKNSKLIKKSIIKSDLVVLNGGNLMRCQSITDLIRLIAFLYPLILARRHNVPYIILPQSTTKLNKLGRKFVYPIFKDARVVWLRERESLGVFKKYFPDVEFLFGPDMAFHINESNLINDNVTDSYHPSTDSINIAMTFRSYGLGDINEFNDKKKEEIQKTIISLIENILKRSTIKLTFVVQTDKDLKITKELYELIKSISTITLEDFRIVNTRNSYELLEFYDTQDILIGMRLHSIILALSKGTPCAGLFDESWGLKNPGLLSYFKLPYSYIGKQKDIFVNEILDLIENRNDYRLNVIQIVSENNNKFEKIFRESLSK